MVVGALPPDPDRFAGEPCSFVMLGWLSPSRFEWGMARYMPDQRWEGYLAYVLDARPGPTGGMTVNPIEIGAAGDDARYVVIDRRRRIEVVGIDEVASQLRGAVETALAGFPDAQGMPPWLASGVLSVPRTGFETLYSRERIFGYGWADEARRVVNRAER
jgi:hypothetical protein